MSVVDEYNTRPSEEIHIPDEVVVNDTEENMLTIWKPAVTQV